MKKHALNDDPVFRDPALEWPDPTPVEVPLKFRGKEPVSLQEEIRRLMMLAEVERQAQGAESFEDADDFDVDEDPDLFDSQFELSELQEEVPIEDTRGGEVGVAPPGGKELDKGAPGEAVAGGASQVDKAGGGGVGPSVEGGKK